MTSYHVGLREHLAQFIAVKDRHIAEPYPAWSAIGVSELITDGALVEIRASRSIPARVVSYQFTREQRAATDRRSRPLSRNAQA